MMTEFGRLSTSHEEMLYAVVLEQRKTNELLQQLVELHSPLVVAIMEPEPVEQPQPEPVKKPTAKGKPKE